MIDEAIEAKRARLRQREKNKKKKKIVHKVRP